MSGRAQADLADRWIRGHDIAQLECLRGDQRIVAKIITGGNSPGPASRPSMVDNLGKVRGAANGVTLSSDIVTTRGSTSNTTALGEDMPTILANAAPAAIVPYVHLKTGTDLSGAKLLTLLATGIVLASQPALSQGAMGSGAPAAGPQPRMDSNSLPSPVQPRSTYIKTEPVIIYNGIKATPGGSNAAGKPQGLPTAGSGGKGAAPADIYSHSVSNGKAGSVGLKQEPSRAPLPAGYAYDATGRIVYVGR